MEKCKDDVSADGPVAVTVKEVECKDDLRADGSVPIPVKEAECLLHLLHLGHCEPRLPAHSFSS